MPRFLSLRPGLRLSLLLLAGLVLALPSRAEPVPLGKGKVTVDVGVPLEVFTYKPANYAGGPLVLVFHGVNRNAEDYRNFALTLGERFGVLVAAPYFDLERFPNDAYQRGGVMKAGRPQPREQWTFALVPKIVAALRAAEGRPDLPYYFLGHSAGGQFLVRMIALAGPLGAERVVAANPGSHLFPTRAARYGYGFGGLPEEWTTDEAIRRYLAAPLTLYLGTGDRNPQDKNLERGEEAMRQGPYRHARGLNCFAFATNITTQLGWTLGWRLVETPDIGHDAAKMFAAPEVGQALFGAAGAPRDGSAAQ